MPNTIRRYSYLLRATLALWLFTCAVAVPPARAQSLAAVSGTVADPSGAEIPGARVTLKNSGTNVEQSTVTNSTGYYAIVNVVPGQYSVEVSKDGFTTEQVAGIALAVNQSATLPFTLKVSASKQLVTVTSRSSEIQTTTAALGTVIASQPVNDLPLNGRNFTELLELTPGVGRISVSQNSGTGGTASNPIGQYTFPAVNGQRNRSNLFLLDGVSNLGGYTDTYNYQPVIDAIQDFKVQSHSDLPEYGQALGGIVSVVTRGGTNQLHGSAWEFLRNSALDSRNFFISRVNPLRQNQFGVALGGPLYLPHIYDGSNKTFFFFTYEGFRQHQASQNLLTTPTAAQLGGDFSNLLDKGVVIYNPFSTQPDPLNPGKYTRAAFTNNIIPQNLLSSAALLYSQYAFPLPNASGLPGGRNLVDTTPSVLDSDSYSGRIDHTFGEHDQVFGRISTYNQPNSYSSSPNIINSTALHGTNFGFQEVHTFGPTSVLTAHFGRNVGVNDILVVFNHAPGNYASALEDAGFSSGYIGGYKGGPQSNVIPLITVSGYLGGSNVNNFQDLQFANTYEYGADYSKIWGRHNIRVGGIVATNNFSMPIASVSESTTSFQTSNLEQPTSPGGAPTGDALASFLLGVPNNAQIRNVNEHVVGGLVNGFYAQDQFLVTRRLTVNYGVRWDVSVWAHQGYLSNGQGYVGTMDLTNGTYLISALPPACSATQGAPCIPGGTLPANVIVSKNGNHSLHYTDFGDWQPRFGFAYHPFGKTSILGSYGRFYDSWNSTTQYAQNSAGTWPSVGLLNNNALNQNIPTATIGNPLNQGTGSVVQPAATPFGNATFYYNPHLKTAYSDQWNFGLEQGLGANTIFNVFYVGSRDGNLDFGALQNTATFAGAGTSAEVASRRRYPYIVPTKWDDSIGVSNYNALQTTLRRTASNGLSYLVSYTWSKSIDVGCSDSFGAGCVVQNPYNRNASRSVSGFDLTHIFSASVTYEIPFGRGKSHSAQSGVANNLLGGWKLNAIASATSGQPFSVTVAGDIANIGNTFVMPNLVGNPNLAQRSPSKWFNTSAFQVPAAGTFGNLGRYTMRSDWFRDLDLSIFKVFTLTEKTNLEFRAEAFNLSNTPVFGVPDSGFTDRAFGTVASLANGPRQIQLAVKIHF